MRQLLMDPHYPDLVAVAAAEAQREFETNRSARATRDRSIECLDAYLTLLGKRQLAADRLW